MPSAKKKQQNMKPSEKKKQKRFDQLWSQIRSIVTTVDIRNGTKAASQWVELCLEAVQIAPSVWTKHRFECLLNFCIYSGEHRLLSKEEKTLMKEQFVDNDKEPMAFRALACVFLADLPQHGNCNFSTPTRAIYLRKAISFIDKSPAKDGERRIYHQKDDSVKGALAEIRSHAQGVLETWEFGLSDEELGTLSKGGTLKMRSLAGGIHCDYCKKPSDEYYSLLDGCGRCHMVFYCSKSCQKKDWKKQHKKACRKKGQIEIGDFMTLKAWIPGSEDEYTVKVIGPADGSDGHWLVIDGLNEPCDGVFAVPARNLVRLRPEHCVVV